MSLARLEAARIRNFTAAFLLHEPDGALHAVLIVTRHVAGEFEIRRAGEDPDEAGGLAGLDPNTAFVRHVRHRMAGVAAPFPHLHPRPHLAAVPALPRR